MIDNCYKGGNFKSIPKKTAKGSSFFFFFFCQHSVNMSPSDIDSKYGTSIEENENIDGNLTSSSL